MTDVVSYVKPQMQLFAERLRQRRGRRGVVVRFVRESPPVVGAPSLRTAWRGNPFHCFITSAITKLVEHSS